MAMKVKVGHLSRGQGPKQLFALASVTCRINWATAAVDDCQRVGIVVKGGSVFEGGVPKGLAFRSRSPL